MLRARRLLFVRWGFLGAVLLAELILLTLNFDSPELRGIETWWAILLRNCPAIPFWGISTALATILVGGNRLRDELWRTIEQASIKSTNRWWPFLLANILACTIFALVTNVVCSEDIQVYTYPDVLVAAWILSGLATVAFWGGTLLAPTLWKQIFRSVWQICIAGAAIGVAACIAGHFSGESWNSWPRFPALWVVTRLLGPFVHEVVYRPGGFIVAARMGADDPAYGLNIASLCSGYDAFGLLWMFLGTHLWFSRRHLRFPNVFLLIPIASVVVWCTILLRLLLLVLFAQVSQQGAQSAAHSQLSWVIFNVIALGIIIGGSHLFRPHAATDAWQPATGHLVFSTRNK